MVLQDTKKNNIAVVTQLSNMNITSYIAVQTCKTFCLISQSLQIKSSATNNILLIYDARTVECKLQTLFINTFCFSFYYWVLVFSSFWYFNMFFQVFDSIKPVLIQIYLEQAEQC